MLSFSTPLEFRQNPTAATKRDKPHDYDPSKPNPKPRPRGPFVDEDEDDDEDDEITEINAGTQPSLDEGSHEPAAKKQMTQHPSQQAPTIQKNTQATDEAEDENQNDNSQDKAAEEVILDTRSTFPSWSQNRLIFSSGLLASLSPASYTFTTCDGKQAIIKQRKEAIAMSYESMVASRTKTKQGRAIRGYYGIDIHELMSSASKEIAQERSSKCNRVNPVNDILPSIERQTTTSGRRSKKSLLWTEKYRARNFMDLCGDDGTNRMVLRWLKKWDSLVFPGMVKTNNFIGKRPGIRKEQEEEKAHRKILMLTGPPGLGKTTLAHVCARQAGYDIMEINASDDRSRDVVKNRIRTSLGTETVKSVGNNKTGHGAQKPAQPVCVIVDEVDGVVGGAGASGEGGFVKALIDLVLVDQKNTASATNGSSKTHSRGKRKGDDFRQMRPLILICNDVYHPSLRPLRQSNLAEIIHVGRPSLDAVVGRLKGVFDKEGISCDKDAARKLCEAAWGMASGADARKGAESTVEGDLRGVMVVGEWVAGRFKSSNTSGNERLTRQWIEQNILHDLSSGAAGARGLGRGNNKEIVSRIFQEGGGFPKQIIEATQQKTHMHEQPRTELGFGEQQKKYAMERLGQMVDTSGEISHILTEVFAEYPNREFNDDCYLTKPNEAYEWLHFHDACQSRIYSSQEWELGPYLSQPVLACHHLFASPKRHYESQGYDKRWGAENEADVAVIPFSGPRADFQAREVEKQNRSQLQAIQAQLSPTLSRSFRSPEDVATEFLPYLIRLLSPDIKPVVVGGSSGFTASVRKESEQVMVKRASEVLADVGIQLVRGKIEGDNLSSRAPQWVYRMEPDLDALSNFETGASLLSSQAPTRYAVRQVLDQELRRTLALREAEARQARLRQGGIIPENSTAQQLLVNKNKENARRGLMEEATAAVVKKDFFGRVIQARPLTEVERESVEKKARREERKVWITFHEGLNNAVRKPMTLQDFMRGL